MHTHSRLFNLLAASALLAFTLSVGADAQTTDQNSAPFVASPPRDTGSSSLAPVRANQPLTMNALLGFINSEPVFVHDMLRPVDDELRALAKPGTSRNISEFRLAARAIIESQMRRYVSDILIMSSANAALTDEDKERLEVFMKMEEAKLITKYGGSRALADQALRAEGSSVDKAMKDSRRSLTVELLLHKQLFPKIVLTRQMVLDEYERSSKKWQQGAEIELFTITLPVTRYLPREPGKNGTLGPPIANPTPEQVKQAEAKALDIARAVVDRLNHGADFALEAYNNDSADGALKTGGRTPKVAKGSLANEKVETYAFSLPAHTLGQPLLIQNSDPNGSFVIIIKIGDKLEARTIPFAEAQQKIEALLRKQQYDQLYNEYIQSLYKGAAIERVDRMTDIAVDVAVARYASQ